MDQSLCSGGQPSREKRDPRCDSPLAVGALYNLGSQSSEVERGFSRQGRGRKGTLDRGYSMCKHMELRKNMARLGAAMMGRAEDKPPSRPLQGPQRNQDFILRM